QANNVKAEAGENKELASSIKDLETTNRQLASYNKGLRSKIANMDAATAKANRKQLDKVLRTQKSNLSNAKKASVRNDGSKSLKNQVERLTSEVSSLERTRTQLLKVEQGTRV
ncbi:MAG: hypothetical protein ABGY95_08605, partial [Rubritalea sp.]|uniref:hypothetical protein n=1 Tax=Rubritalea sp. TaxID=2109375 RepID=UPI0032425ABD